MIRSFADASPTLGADVWIDPMALVIGDVTLHEGVSVWPGAVLRGDVNRIEIGADTNLQDGVIVHVNQISPRRPAGTACRVGRAVTVGHRATLHACTIGNEVLVGIGAIVLDEVVVEDQVLIGAGSVVAPGKVLESGFLYLGTPARKVRPLTEEERAYFAESAAFYRKLAATHHQHSQAID
ncbi:gamma carbonic anhydrase family protein [Halothiobacillus sp. DCM-1]|uniref:gamma carbonic anhydrase family protein n=1 Tax=Halothiobacillus sp. DCM-1 TaxID=3112558 RepID=UPI00324894B3